MANGKHKPRGIIPYKTYSFIDKDPVIDVVRTAMQKAKLSSRAVSAESGVSASAINNWLYGGVRRPQFATVNAALRACGQEFVARKIKV